ncbi:UNVERIFIED_CONTAM: hypothetical protein Sradi_3317300 [Sesamum radiatum]|uniref:Uncharacterized protein n=1 Tax=Sesamum radiatum TaxID=300843 RepID=A0AAW2R1T9_SESRA
MTSSDESVRVVRERSANMIPLKLPYGRMGIGLSSSERLDDGAWGRWLKKGILSVKIRRRFLRRGRKGKKSQ